VNTDEGGKRRRTANLNERRDTISWEAIDWPAVEAFINKAQTRIAKAVDAGNRKPETWNGRETQNNHYWRAS
jgi:hypothetical protein